MIANIIWASLSVFFANFSKHIIDGAVEYHDLQYVIRYAIALFCIIMAQLTCNLFSNSFSSVAAAGLIWLSKGICFPSNQKDYSSVSAYHTGELQNRMFNDVTVVTDGMTNILPNVAFYIVKLLCAFVYLVYY
jgi:ATP-binding cassette subfamily B protein